jgi:hypothetical protein
MAFASFGAALDRARELNKASYDPRVLYQARRSHTSEIYVAKLVNGIPEERIYS